MINLSTSTPMRNALIKLNEYPGEKAPPGFSGIVKSTTRTDERGYFRFDFDAYYPPGNAGIDNRAAYSVEFDTEGRGKGTFTSLNTESIDLEEYYGVKIAPYDHIDSIGEVNFSPIYVVMVRRLFFQFHNVQYPISESDSLIVDLSNQFLSESNVAKTFYSGETEFNSNYLNRPYVVPSGQNFAKFHIYKGGNYTVRDTSFFVDPEGIGDIVLHVNY